MSHRTLMVVAISVLGLAGWKSQAADRSDEADVQAVETPAAAAATATPKLVLLTDGRILSGTVSEEDGVIALTQPAGVMKFHERKVERVFDTIQEVHKYKLEQVPEDDMDEQLKLAQWCLSKKLAAEARGHIDSILKIDPKHVRAKAMLESIDMADSRATQRQQRDAAVQQTSAEIVEPGLMERPAALDNAVVRGARRGMGVSDLPVVFDLPPGAALKRAQEFQNFVHPVLQTYCAKCHNDRYEGDFQLIEFKRKADRTPDSLRTNLDAVLRLVDRENPGRSDLLASSLRPHGRGPNTRPIFQGSNDKAYQILAAWVNNLRVKPSPAPSAAGSGLAAPNGSTEDFAVSRTRISRGTVDVEPVAGGPVVGGPVQTSTTVIPPMRYTPGTGFVDEEAADPNEYPVPFAVTGVKPNLPPAAAAAIPKPKRLPIAKPAAPNATGAGLPPLPSADQAAAAALEAGGDDEPLPAPAAKKPAKKLKLDPALLERALQLKNSNR